MENEALINQGAKQLGKIGCITKCLASNHLDSFQGEPTVKTQSSFIVNGRIALADIPLGSVQSMTLSLWGRNLFDESHNFRRSNANANTLGHYANFNPPRTFGIEAQVVF